MEDIKELSRMISAGWIKFSLIELHKIIPPSLFARLDDPQFIKSSSHEGSHKHQKLCAIAYLYCETIGAKTCGAYYPGGHALADVATDDLLIECGNLSSGISKIFWGVAKLGRVMVIPFTKDAPNDSLGLLFERTTKLPRAVHLECDLLLQFEETTDPTLRMQIVAFLAAQRAEHQWRSRMDRRLQALDCHCSCWRCFRSGDDSDAVIAGQVARLVSGDE